MKQGEMRIITAGRGVGKSMYNEYLKTLEEEMATRLAKEIAEDIDFGIMKELLAYKHEFSFKEHISLNAINMDPSIMNNWCKSNCKDGFIHNKGLHWCFESERDLNWFKLRWL